MRRVAVLDVPAGLERQRALLPAGSVTSRDIEFSRSSPVRPPLLLPGEGRAELVVTDFCGSTETMPCALALLYSCGPRSRVLGRPPG